MATAQNLTETFTGSDPNYVEDSAETAAPQELADQPKKNEFDSETLAAPNPPSGSEDTVRIPLAQIFIDGSIFPRASLDIYTVQQYAAALIRGEKLPPITVEETKDHDYRVLKGVHRFQAYCLRRDVQTGNLVADFYDDPLPLISDTELNTIPCFIETVPPNKPPIVVALEDNQKNGKPLTTEDYKKVARQLYKDNVGAPLQSLAKLIKISRKVFTKYVADLVEAFEQEKESLILELHDQGLSHIKISETLQKEFDKAKGLSDTQVGDFLQKNEQAKKADTEDGDHAGAYGKDLADDSQIEEDDAGDVGEIEKEIEPQEPSPKPVELKVIYGNDSDTIMILGLTSLAPHLQEKLKTGVESLVNEVREENRAAQENDEQPEQVDPEPHAEAPEEPKISVYSDQPSNEKPLVQKFRPAIQPSRGSRPRQHTT